MAQSVVYADLKFAAGPSSTVPDDDDSPYENVPLGPVTAEPSPGRWTRPWRARRALLTAGLLLLLLVLLVAVVALAACYWQVSRSLQDTSHEHTAEQGRLSQELRAQEQSLKETQLELAWARKELQRAWHDGNITKVELESRNAELGNTQEQLAVLQEEMQVVQGRLNASESTVSSLRACMNSVTKKTWKESHQDCSGKSAQLLAQDSWLTLIVPHFVHESNASYWIETRTFHDIRRSSLWMDHSYFPKHHISDCSTVVNGEIWNKNCGHQFQWICEKSPKLSSASEIRPPFLTKD